MSADIYSHVTIRGTEEEMLSMIKVLRHFEKDCYEQYESQGDCAYIQWVRFKKGRKRLEDISLEDISDDELPNFVKTLNGEANIDITGPYGEFFDLSEVGLFEAMAEAAPNASFEGLSNGFETGADISLQAILSNGILEIENYNRPNDTYPDFASVMTEKISLSDFCKIAVIDEDEFDEDDYYDFYLNIDGSNLEDMEYDEFIDYCEASGLVEDDYPNFVKKMIELGYMNDDEFQEYSEDNEEEYTESYQYDPVKKMIVDNFSVDEAMTLGEYIDCVNSEKLGYFKKLEKQEKAIKKCVPYEDFASLFEFDTSNFTEDDYDGLFNGDFLNEFSEFIKFIYPLEYNEEKWKTITDEIKKMKIKG